MRFPEVSFVVCTYSTKNYETKYLIKKCLDSIFAQDYPKERFEVICVDGGSDAAAIDLIKKYPVNLVRNKKRFPEGCGMGKAQGVAAAFGEIIAFVDQDNELIGKNWLRNMVAPLENPEILGCDCRLLVNKKDPAINRYLSLVGTDPFAAYRSIHGILGFGTARLEDRGDYFVYDNSLADFVVAGGNCFLIRKRLLDEIGGYTKDVDVMYKLAKMNLTKFAIPKSPRTHHRTATSFFIFFKKKFLWSLHKSADSGNYEFSWAPKTTAEWNKLLRYVSAGLLVAPNIPFALERYFKSGESAWLLHPLAVFLSICIIGIAALSSIIRAR